MNGLEAIRTSLVCERGSHDNRPPHTTYELMFIRSMHQVVCIVDLLVAMGSSGCGIGGCRALRRDWTLRRSSDRVPSMGEWLYRPCSSDRDGGAGQGEEGGMVRAGRQVEKGSSDRVASMGE